MIQIVIEGVPVPWKAHGGFGRKSFNPRFKEKECYQHQIRKQYFGAPIEKAVFVYYSFFMPIPSSLSQKQKEKMHAGEMFHIKRPDVTNLVKFCEDTLKYLIIKDDSQVVTIHATKYYDIKPRTQIDIGVA
jgi:Holliday junction resolvase RusA-like endonuclease